MHTSGLKIVPILLCLLLNATASAAQYAPGNIFSAARGGDLDRLRSLIDDKTSQHILNQALGAAVVGGQTEVMDFLIETGAGVDHTSSWGNALLINAIMYEQYEAAKILIEAGANVNVRGYSRVVFDISIKWDWTPLMCAARKGNLELVKLLLEHGAQADEQGWSSSSDQLETAADIAAYSGHLDVLKYLMRKDSPVRNETLYACARGGHLDTLKYLMKKKRWDVDRLSAFSGRTLLMEASRWGHMEIVRYLVKKKKADINVQGRHGYTALSEAVSAADETFPDQSKIVEFLIKNGADVNLASQFHLTPLMRAKRTDKPEIVKILLKHGAK